MTEDEKDELETIESHLTWLVDLVQRRIDACGRGEGLNNPARQAEALAGIAENKRIAAEAKSVSLLPSTAADFDEVAWLERHIGQVAPTPQPQFAVYRVQRTELRNRANYESSIEGTDECTVASSPCTFGA